MPREGREGRASPGRADDYPSLPLGSSHQLRTQVWPRQRALAGEREQECSSRPQGSGFTNERPRKPRCQHWLVPGATLEADYQN